jgi:hypothetical protein
MAHLGHNHVVSAAPLHGSVWIHPQVERSGFDVTFAVNGMIVDDPAARLAAGEEFASAVPAASREGTRRNMLRAEVLDGARYPEISLRSVSVSGPLSSPAVMARVTIRAVSRDVPVPAHVSLAGETLVVTGGLDLLQSDFGITPYSVALGALQVQDRLHVTYRIVAVRQPQR